jgi:hypothetical protein
VFRLFFDRNWLEMFLISFLFVDERENVQKKTFTKWVNSHLIRVGCRIHDLYTDLRDGKMILKLLEVLSGERLVRLSSLLSSGLCFFAFSLSLTGNGPHVG